MTPQDLADIHSECFTTPRPWSKREFQDLLASPTVFLCHADGGFVLGRIVADEAELLTIAVRPTARRAGVGRYLLKQFEATSRRQGATTAFLEVSETNAPAIALYQIAGYSLAGSRRGYYRDPDGLRLNALVYSRALG